MFSALSLGASMKRGQLAVGCSKLLSGSFALDIGGRSMFLAYIRWKCGLSWVFTQPFPISIESHNSPDSRLERELTNADDPLINSDNGPAGSVLAR
jgi:hypothetical protein